ncbi:MAG: nuclear transport factor 2 family protein [Gemmatimonadetes bacterium]|nr:nuclear transport factor 2 family protein [Gemmatimonadota bacterium]MBT8479927.1 nuclear transport factor 2 family protein [Gemmatimonadota bacterium]NNK48266.1 SnoaL-like domain-containing protein [Gemmatimonadota bacterium]
MIALSRFRNLALCFAVLWVSGCTIEIEDEGDSDVQGAVERMLVESARAWNRGELAGFMDDYLKSENTTYIGGRGLLTGYDAIRARYAPLFEPGAARDSLRFENVRVRRLAAIDAVATARWVLYDGEAVTGSGPFTLVLRRTSSGWKIIHDHSSSDPALSPAAD